MQNYSRSKGVPGGTPTRAHLKKSPGPHSVRTIAETWAALARWPQNRIVAREVANAFGHLQPAQITPLMVGALVARWKAQHRRSTAYAYRSKLTHLLRTLAEHGAPPIKPERIRAPHARAVTAKPDELARLLGAATPWLRLFILLYLQCGLRLSEALAVTPRTWNPDNHSVTIPVKGGNLRTAEVTPDVEILFAAAGPQPEADKPFLWLLRGRSLSKTALLNAWQKHKRHCGVNPQVTAHDLRRTAATILYTATKDLRIAQQLLGHKNLTSTLTYLAPLAPDEARRYVELLRFDHFHSEVKQ